MAKPQFAKLFETEEYGQVAVKLAEGDEGLEVRIYFQPKGLGLCSFALIFHSENKAKLSAKCFDRMDSSKAMELVAASYDKFDLPKGGSNLSFAKLYDTKDYGQILVLLDEDEDESEARFYFQPAGMGVYDCSLPFKTDAKARKGFERITESNAVAFINGYYRALTLKSLPKGVASDTIH